MALRRMKVDWRGVPDLSGTHDFVSVYHTTQVRPMLTNPKARVLVCWQPCVLFVADAVAVRPYNLDLYHAAEKRGALTDKVLWQGEGGWNTRLIDLTRRGVIADMIALVREHFPFADGSHLDYFTAMSWAFPDLAPLDEAWDRNLAALATGLRAMKPGYLVLGQQFSPTPPTTALSGQFYEQSPTSFGQTMESHTEDLRRFRDLLRMAKDGRETLFVSELREPARFPAWYVSEWRAWAEREDIVISEGRDGTAVGA